MRRKGWLVWLVCVVLGKSRPSAGARPVLEGLDPTIFGSVLDLSTSRFVNSGEDLRAYLSDVTVSTLLLNDSVILSSEFWTSSVVIEQRAVQIISAGSGQAAVDLGGLVDAIHVASTGVLGMRGIATRNAGPSALVRLDSRARYKVDAFGIWPSITVDPGAKVMCQNCTIYSYSEKRWQQCALFQNYTDPYIRQTGYKGRITNIGQTQIRIIDNWRFKSNITDLATNRTVGVVNRDELGVSVVCQPDPFVGLSLPGSAGAATPAPALYKDDRMPRWGGLLCGVTAFLALVFVGLLGFYLYERRASRKLRAQGDVENAENAATQPASGRTGVGKMNPYAASLDSSKAPWSPAPDQKLKPGYSRSLESQSSDGLVSSRDDGMPSVETPAPSSHDTSIADAVMGLPDILRARSAQLVGSLELGAPLGRGSYGKVYKGKWKGTTVAVKIIEHSAETSSGIKELRESVLSSSIIHPNVVSTYKIRTIPAACPKSCQAYAQQKEIDAYQSEPSKEKRGSKSSQYGPEMLETWLLLEFCDRGTLDRAIMQKQTLYFSNGKPNLEFMYRCLIDIAAGMDYLHSLGVINGDLKPANVLLKSTNEDARGFTCKLADFGLSRVLDTDRTHVSTQTYGTLAYQPAELLQEGKLTKAADAHSFSMIMYEMYTKQRIFDGCNTGQAFYKILMGYRPALPADMPEGYRSVMTSCWSTDSLKRPGFDLIIQCLQNLLSEHLQEQEGMEKVATIDRPFSDERTMSRFEKDAENVAFLARIKAATREAHGLPAENNAERRSFSRADIRPIPEGHESGSHVESQDGNSSGGGWLGTEEMGEELVSARGPSLEMHRVQSVASSFDEQLWEELEAQARRRRSNDSSIGPSPFARQLATQGTPTLFGQPGQPVAPMPRRPSAFGQAMPPAATGNMTSPFAAAANSKKAVAAQQALLSQAADAHADQRPASQEIQRASRSIGALQQQPSSASALSSLQSLQNGHSGLLVTDAPGSKECPTTHQSSSAAGLATADSAKPDAAGVAPAQSNKPQVASEKPLQEAMSIDELAVLNKRPKRRPVQHHRLAEMMAALDAKDTALHNSFGGSELSKQEHDVLLSKIGTDPARVLAKAVSEGCTGGEIAMSTFLDVKSISQSVPELPPQASTSGAGKSWDQVQVANEHILTHVLRKKMGPNSITASNASRVSSLLHSFPSTASGSAHVIPPSPFEKPQMQSAASTANAHGLVPQPSPFQSLPAKPHERTVTFAEACGRRQGSASSYMVPEQNDQHDSNKPRSHSSCMASKQADHHGSQAADERGVYSPFDISSWGKTGMCLSHGPGDHSSHDEAEHGNGGCSHELLLLQLMQQGVEGMGSALEVSPSAFGGFTIREDFVGAMRLSIRHTKSMPAEGQSRAELEVTGRNGGPTTGCKSPASASMHQRKLSPLRGAEAFAQHPDIESRGKSMPSKELVKIYSSKIFSRCGCSLGPLPLERRDFLPPAIFSEGKSIANGVHQSPDDESPAPQENPFASSAMLRLTDHDVT